MPKLSLSMIVKNEEKYLRECLESVKGVVDEIVIVDTGSEDKTTNIAKEFNAKIFNFDWINDFSAARNFALSKSNGDWILYLDADERISEKAKKEFQKIIESSNKLGVKCLVNSVDTFRNNSQMMKYIRLFKNDSKIRFTGKAHEQIETSLVNNGYQIIDSNIEIVHYGYDVSDEKLKEKAKRNLNLLLLDYSKKKTSYLAYQIANSYSVLNDENNKNFFYAEAIKDNCLNKDLRSVCFMNLADFEMRLENIAKSKEYIDKGLSENKNHSLLCLVGTQVYLKLNDYKKALTLCKEALGVNTNNKLNYSKFGNQLILIDDAKIIYQGILISVIAQDLSSGNYFLNELSNLNILDSYLIEKLYTGSNLTQSDATKLVKFTSKDNLELILKLLENFQNSVQKLEYLSIIKNKFSSNSKFQAYYGSFLISQSKTDLAQQFFESSINEGNFESSVIFYLSSLYIKSNQFEKLIELLEKSESAAIKNPSLQQGLNVLKEKLMPILR
jgi:glycosyltransferase involved in cell wall biosynthesis